LCELATADSASSLVQIVAVTLGVPLRSGLDPVDSIVEFLKAKRLLLVLDNCEHLIEAAGALAERVIQMCPDVRIVATSREGLAVDGEQVIPLRSLAVPDPTNDPGAVAGSAAARLFVERAQAAHAGFELRPVDAPAVAEICRRLDGIPLAIELAAARVVGMAPAEIAGLLDERFRLLTGGRRTAVERHQTLRATVDWSYSMLDERDRTVFDRLGVFAGTFDADAAAAVASGDGIERFDVLDALSDLVAKSLVVAELTEGGTTRYSMLETLRQYARERLDEADTSDDRRRRHASYYADVSEQLAPGLFSPDEIATRSRIQLELDNLRAAVGWALDCEARDDNEFGVRIPAAFFTEGAMGRASGTSDWAIRALPFVDSTTPERRYKILCAVAWDAHAQAQIQRCMELSLAVLAEPIPDTEYFTSAYLSLAGAYAFQGNIEEAMRLVHEALALAEARGAPDWLMANTLAVGAMHQLGNQELESGRVDAQRAVEFAQRSRNPSALALATYSLGWALCGVDDDAAVDALSENIKLCEGGAIDATLAPAQCQRGVLRLHAGRHREGVPDIRAAFERSVEIADALTIGAATMSTVYALAEQRLPGAAAVVMGVLDAGVIFSFGGSGYGLFDLEELRTQIMTALSPSDYASNHGRGAAMSYDDAVAFVRAALADLVTMAESADD
jgi:predicted ATPase